MDDVFRFLCILIGGFFGSILRSVFSRKLDSEKFPYGTLLANIIASFLLGLFVSLKNVDFYEELLIIGFSSSLSTFSSLAWQLSQMLLKKELTKMSIYIFVSLFFGVLSFYIGNLIF